MVPFVLVRDEVGTRQGDVVGEGGGVPVNVIAVAEHVLAKLAAAIFEGFDCNGRKSYIRQIQNQEKIFLWMKKGLGGGGAVPAFRIFSFRTAFLAFLALAAAWTRRCSKYPASVFGYMFINESSSQSKLTMESLGILQASRTIEHGAVRASRSHCVEKKL